MTMALQVQGSMYYKLGLYDQALTSLEKGIAICPHLREWREPSTLHLGRSLRMALHDRPEGERHRTHIPLRRQLRRPRQMERRAWESGPDRTLSRHLPLSPSLVFPEKGQIKETRRLLDEAARFIHPQIPANAYEHFYEARRELRKMTGDYQGAIKDMDILLTAHEGDLSFYMDDLLKKAELLAHSGDPRSCISLYHTYIQVKDSVKPVGYRLSDGSTTDYLRGRPAQPREAIRKELDVRRLYRLLAPFPLLAGYIIYSQCLKAKNQVLYRRIQEQIRQENKAVETIKQIPRTIFPLELRLFINLNELLEKKSYTPIPP